MSGVVMLFTEQTPNPETLKYVTNRLLYRGIADFSDEALAAEWSPMAHALLQLPYIKAAYFNNNYVTLTKELNYDWHDIMLIVKEFIKEYLEKDGIIVKDGFGDYIAQLQQQQSDQQFSGEDGAVARKVKELIDMYVKPAVEGDGGNIEFKKFDKGKVFVTMQGACSGCPSSSVTLKAGIEGMLKRMVPEVTEVVQDFE